jgi:hypothetical protein
VTYLVPQTSPTELADGPFSFTVVFGTGMLDVRERRRPSATAIFGSRSSPRIELVIVEAYQHWAELGFGLLWSGNAN